jgi:hypothetical protein
VKQVFKEILQGKDRPPQSSEPPFKEKEKGGGRIHAWWSMKIPCLVVNGRRRRRFLATYSHFPLSNFI